MPSVQVFVGSLLLVAAAVVFATGVALRLFIGRRADSAESQRRLHAFRRTRFARVLFGSVYDDEVFHALRGTTIVRAWALFSPWIQARRDFIKQPDLYEELEKMPGRMQEIQAAQARSPIQVV